MTKAYSRLTTTIHLHFVNDKRAPNINEPGKTLLKTIFRSTDYSKLCGGSIPFQGCCWLLCLWTEDDGRPKHLKSKIQGLFCFIGLYLGILNESQIHP